MPYRTDVDTPNGKIALFIYDGIVKNHQTQRWSTTHISSTGGGGYVAPVYNGQGGGGVIEPVRIHSQTTHYVQSDFWLSEPNGSEHKFCLDNSKFPVLTGQRVRLVGGVAVNKCVSGLSSVRILFGWNKNSGGTCFFADKTLWAWAKSQKLANYPLWYRWGVTGIPALCAVYWTLVWLPLRVYMMGAQIEAPTGLVDFLRVNAALAPLWSWDMVRQATMATSDVAVLSQVTLSIVLFGLGWLAFSLLAWLLIGRHYQNKILAPIRAAIARTCQNETNARR